MKERRHNAWKRYGWWLPGIVLALLLELVLAGLAASHGYGSGGGRRTVEPVRFYDYNQENGRYTVTGPAPNMELEVGGDAGFVELFFSEPLAYDREVYCYYVDREGKDFNPYQRIERFLMAGSTRAEFALPREQSGLIRIDIRGDFILERIEVGEKIPLSGLDAGMIVGRMNLPRLLAMAVILGGTGYFLAEKVRPVKRRSASRTVYLDAARIAAAFFVIAVHVVEPVSVLQEPGTLRGGIFNGTVMILLTCNLMFFFISGALLLSGREESIGTFYKKRLWKIVLPFAVYSCFYLAGMCASGMGVLPWLSHAVPALLEGKVLMAPHFWMIYEMLGVYLLAPFFRMMVRNLTERMEQWLFGLIVLSLLFRTGQLYLNQPLAVGTFLDSWPGIFLGGYLLTRPWMRRLDGMIAALGAASFALSLRLSFVRTDFMELVCNRSILMFCMTAAFFVLLMRGEKLLRPLAPFLSVLSRYSYSVLLVHWFAMSAVLNNGLVPEVLYSKSLYRMIFSIAVVTVLSIMLAFLTDHTVLFFIQEGLPRIGRSKKK